MLRGDNSRGQQHRLRPEQSFLAKYPEGAGTPMAYRILNITSVLSRVWASVRVKHLERWVAQWAGPAMFAGVPGAGAEEGWYLTQLDFEIKRLTGSQVAAGSIDVYKCFDQIVRPLVVALARAAGMPTAVLSTYEAFQDNLAVYNHIGTGLGTPHQHRCSIPQGCPFSMALVTLLVRPWMYCMRDIGWSRGCWQTTCSSMPPAHTMHQPQSVG